MSIVVHKEDPLRPGSTSIFPQVDYRDYDGKIDHRQEIIPIQVQYPPHDAAIVDPPSSEENFIAKYVKLS